jgi:uncharacterized BrkB/YihY/UPF0761 family membrane protein
MDGRATVAGQDWRLGAQASLTLYAGLCILAVLTTLVAVLGLAGSDPGTSDAVLDVVARIGGASSVDIVDGPIEGLVGNRQLAGALFAGGLVATAALSLLYVRALRGGSRPKRGPLHALARIVAAQLVVVIGLCVIATGPASNAIGDVSGIPSDAITAWDFGKWPVLLILAFTVFATIQRTAFADPTVLPSRAVRSSQVLALLVWLLATTGFVMYLASFSHFQDTYGTIGAAIVLLVWLTMFSVLHYATPDLRGLGGGRHGARAFAAAVTWLAVCGALAVCVARLDSTDQTYVAVAAGVLFAVGLWITNGVVLRAVRFSSQASPAIDELVHVVTRALQDDAAHDNLLSPVDNEEGAPRLSALELDLSDWGFTYGVAWAVARAQDTHEPDASVAQRALAAAQEVFHTYCGTADWAERIGRASPSAAHGRGGSPNGQRPARAPAGEAS